MRITSIISLSLLLFFNSVYAQKVKRVKEKTDLGWTVIYSVLKTDNTIKHGKYKEIGYWPQTLIVSGKYKLGEKSGLWVTRHPGGSLISKGNYLKGNRVGKWIFHGPKKRIQEYDYDSKTLVTSKECGTNKLYEALIENQFEFTKLDCPPSIVGGVSAFSMLLTSKFGRTLDRKKNKNKFNLYYASISVLIKKDGTIGDIKSEEPNINNDLKVFIENELNNVDNEWLAGELNGEKVDAYLKIYVNLTVTDHKKQI